MRKQRFRDDGNVRTHRPAEHPVGFSTRAWAVAALSVLIGMMVACGQRETSEVAVSQAEAVETANAVETTAPAPVSTVPPVTNSADTFPSEQDSATSAGPTPTTAGPDYSPPLSETQNEERSEVLPLPAVAPSANRSGGGLSAALDNDQEPPRPQILHVNVDGDSAVIVSAPEADRAQSGEIHMADPPQAKGERFIWHDGDLETPVWLDTRLEVADVIPGGGWGDPTGPVFWSESDELMALPGGVVLMLDPTLGEAAVDAFMESNDINPSQAEAFEGLINAFVVKTDPGFPSLWLANSLAGQGGVVISSPNWWMEGLIE